MLTDAVEKSLQSWHRTAMQTACNLTDSARASRVYEKDIALTAADADKLAEILTILVGTNNTLVAVVRDAEMAATETQHSVSIIRKASLGRLIRIWLGIRSRARVTA